MMLWNQDSHYTTKGLDLFRRGAFQAARIESATVLDLPWNAVDVEAGDPWMNRVDEWFGGAMGVMGQAYGTRDEVIKVFLSQYVGVRGSGF